MTIRGVGVMRVMKALLVRKDAVLPLELHGVDRRGDGDNVGSG